MFESNLILPGLLGLAAYLLGSIPTAYLLARWTRGIDIRRVGSKNVGALNALHQVGTFGGLAVLAVDTAKGALAVLVPVLLGAPVWTCYLTGVLVVAGHNWSVFLRFGGGKGAATILGISLVILPQLTLIALALTLLLILLTRNVVIGVGVGFILVNALAVATGQAPDQVALCILLSLMV
ncbi:MAG: glycerol-3-phosphate acyltransferase, partial [Dehalococcoidia bacterium]